MTPLFPLVPNKKKELFKHFYMTLGGKICCFKPVQKNKAYLFVFLMYLQVVSKDKDHLQTPSCPRV